MVPTPAQRQELAQLRQAADRLILQPMLGLFCVGKGIPFRL
jgi:hypothetical protein